MKFRFQINGIMQGESVGQITEYISKLNQWRLETEITGVSVFEVPEPKPHYSGKGIPRKKGL